MKNTLPWYWKWHQTHAFQGIDYTICISEFPTSIWTYRICSIKPSECMLPMSLCVVGPGLPVLIGISWHVLIFFYHCSRSLGYQSYATSQDFLKTNLGIKSQEEMRTIWKFENPHVLYVFFFFFSRKDFKVSTCFNASPSGCFINENSSIF